MDIDEEILQRLTNTEDHLTERKSKPHRDQATEAMVAFANSALPNKPGILYVGVNDKGDILQDKAPETWQHDITTWGNGCFPELPVIPRTLTKDGKEFLAVVVPLSALRPHFARPAFKREGAKTVRASQNEIDEWIAYRNSKVRVLLEQKDQKRPVQVIQLAGPQHADIRNARHMVKNGQYHILDCSYHFVSLESLEGGGRVSEALSVIDFKWDFSHDWLVLLIRPYVT
jgi:schlafen family protein